MSTTSRKNPFGLPKHGTESTYVNWGCRCSKCRKANTLAVRARRVKRNARLNGAA